MESFTVAGSNAGVARTDVTSSGVSKAPPTFVVASAANCYNNKSNRASSVPFNKYCTLPAAATIASPDAKIVNTAEPLAVSVARSTFYGLSSIRRSTYGRSTSPVYSTARSKFYAMNGGGGGGVMPTNDDGTPKLTVVQPVANGETNSNATPYLNGYPKGYRSVETRYGVTAVTTPHGVTHYFIPSTATASSDLASTVTASPQDCKTVDNYPIAAGNRLSTDGLATRL